MKLKNKARILGLVPFLLVLLAWPFVPEAIPAHYGADGAVTRWGSRWELFLMPVFTAAFTELMLWFARLAKKQEQTGAQNAGGNNETVMVCTTIWVQVIFDVITAAMIFTGMKGVENLDFTGAFPRMIVAALGLLCILTGNWMPKLRRNSIMGLRTPSSGKNDAVWKKCQRFGGITLVLIGAGTILAAAFAPSADWAGVIFLILIAAALPVQILYCRYAARKDSTQTEMER